MSDELVRGTTSLCSTCKRSIDATIWRSEGRIVMRKRCPQHGSEEVIVSSNAAWYDTMMDEPPVLTPPAGAVPASQGCPFDCGPCTSHEQQVLLPIVPITSACNLDCPICYTHNRNEGAFHMSQDQLRAILGHIRRADPSNRMINLTGGEPTQHPDFERLVELCHAEGINRITISTHGLRFLKDEWLLERLAALDARIVLSFDSFTPGTNIDMLGGNFYQAKMRVLALLEKYKVDTTLLPVLARGSNDHEVGAFVKLALEKDFIRSVELHTMTFTGQGGSRFDRRGRYTTYDVLADLEQQTDGALRITDFVPSPSSHPMCYLITYMLRLDDGRWLPFTRFMERADLRALLTGTLYLEPTPQVELRLQDVITRLWAGEIDCPDSDLVLATLKGLLARMFGPGLSTEQRMRIGEQSSKAIYVHSHMDEETFDTDRIRQCCVGIREPDGRNVPSCAYNILYRDRDTRFSVAPGAPVATLGSGRLTVS
ncbi:MoaA/NifB/PqqE family protein MJ0619 [Janthinobacterium sp. CG23_2]|nr:MoaA/NifB/PqqE family protein MJ0619 [Janthinobacterium sp. CG23_2]CUU32620.1 MoaA/NifB/PqqE family protein MJ0619 [Janthinobacterium sp. CG23_2]